MTQDNALKTDLYQATMMAAFFMANKSEELATHDLFVRKLPESRNYLLACGLEEAIDYLKNLHFTKEQIDYIRTLPGFDTQSESFFDMLRDFRFRGDVWSVKEGTAVFQNEPIMILSGPTNQVEFVETYLLGIIGSSTKLASKAARIAYAAAPATASDFSTRRDHPDAAPTCARAAYIAGFTSTSNMEAGMRYGMPVSGTMAHAFVLSFDSEMEAFSAYAKAFPKNTVFLVDTYDIEQGIKNAIKVAKEMETRGDRAAGIRIDSGDLARFSRLARELLDKEGLGYMKIILTNDLDEYKIAELKSSGARFDVVGCGTMLITPSDSTSIGQVYKLSEHESGVGIMSPKLKVSEGKSNLPGLKQVRRYYGRDKRCYMDEITLVQDDYKTGVPLLEKVMERGEVIVRMPTLEEIREHARKEIDSLPLDVRGLSPNKYTIGVSPSLSALEAHLIRESKDKIEAAKNAESLPKRAIKK